MDYIFFIIILEIYGINMYNFNHHFLNFRQLVIAALYKNNLYEKEIIDRIDNLYSGNRYSILMSIKFLCAESYLTVSNQNEGSKLYFITKKGKQIYENSMKLIYEIEYYSVKNKEVVQNG